MSIARSHAGITLIVEWENSRHAQQSRTHEMLALLARQVEDIVNRKDALVEVIIAFDPGKANISEIFAAMGEHWLRLASCVDIRLIPFPEASYYVMKNKAALEAKGDLIVFIDCDVLPQPGWLESILQPLEDPSVGVSQGATFVEPDNLYTLGLALAWLFPLKMRNGKLSEENLIIANNIAFRRSVFLQNPYPPLSTWRGQCTAQRKLLEAKGVAIHWSDSARTIHPFPDGLFGTIERACLNGHDHATRHISANGKNRDWKSSYWRFWTFQKRARTRREKLRDELSLSKSGELVCTLVAAGYWGIAFISECMLHLFPDIWRSALKELPGTGEVSISLTPNCR